MSEVTRILTAIDRGDARAADELLPLVYDELRRLADQKLSQEAPGGTLQATALVHEAYIRLAGEGDHGWQGRRHFFSAAAEAMRRILIERARRKKRHAHGGGRRRLDIDDLELTIDGPPDDLIDLDEALRKLVDEDPQAAQVVHLRYFAGLTIAQVAAIMDVSTRTADRLWAYARAWLHQEITADDGPAK